MSNKGTISQRQQSRALPGEEKLIEAALSANPGVGVIAAMSTHPVERQLAGAEAEADTWEQRACK